MKDVITEDKSWEEDTVVGECGIAGSCSKTEFLA